VPTSMNIMVDKRIGLFLEFGAVFLLILSPREAFTSESAVEVFNVGLFVLFVGTGVAVQGTATRYRFNEQGLELAAIV
jgi:hypothetical protein